MDCLLQIPEFDVASTAGWYSAIAGLLAGFAFVAILLPLEHGSVNEAGPDLVTAIVAFACAFFSLLMLALNYAVLAGRGGDQDVAVHEQMLNGAAFGLAALLLLFGLQRVLRTYGAERPVFEPALRVLQVIVSVLGPVLVLAQQFSSALDLEGYRQAREGATGAPCEGLELPTGVWIDLGIIAAGVVAIICLAIVRTRLPRVPAAAGVLSIGVVAFTAVVAGWTTLVVPLLDDSVTTGPLVEHLTLALSAAALTAFSATSYVSYPPSRPSAASPRR